MIDITEIQDFKRTRIKYKQVAVQLYNQNANPRLYNKSENVHLNLFWSSDSWVRNKFASAVISYPQQIRKCKLWEIWMPIRIQQSHYKFGTICWHAYLNWLVTVAEKEEKLFPNIN